MENKPSPPQLRGAPEKLLREVVMATAKIGTMFVVVIGVSLLFFLPSCACTTQEYRYTQMMKSELKNLWSQQEIYYVDHEAYGASLSELLMIDHYPDGFHPSTGTILIVDEATSHGFSAHATHYGTSVRCVLFSGDVRPPDPDIPTGQVFCSDPNESD